MIKFNRWPASLTSKFLYKYLDPTFSSGYDPAVWRNFFRPCASQRLFMSETLVDVDSVIYVDSDMLFLNDVVKLWNRFDYLTPIQILGMVPEEAEPFDYFMDPYIIPYHLKYQLNSGLLLMNLTRMREFKFIEKIQIIYKKYRKVILTDQCLFNILFSQYPSNNTSYNYKSIFIILR